jgi:hypothetical protein
MLYVSDDGTRATIAMATSDDGVTWDRRGTTLSPGYPDPDHDRVRSPSLLHLHDGSLRLWYATHTVGDEADGCHLWSADLADTEH